MKNKKLSEIAIPHYVSTFDLEEARLGQAVQALKLEVQNTNSHFAALLNDPLFLKPILLKIRNESINLEWALQVLLEESAEQKNQKEMNELILNLLNKLLTKK